MCLCIIIVQAQACRLASCCFFFSFIATSLLCKINLSVNNVDFICWRNAHCVNFCSANEWLVVLWTQRKVIERDFFFLFFLGNHENIKPKIFTEEKKILFYSYFGTTNCLCPKCNRFCRFTSLFKMKNKNNERICGGWIQLGRNVQTILSPEYRPSSNCKNQ